MHFRTAFITLLVFGLASVRVADAGAEKSPNDDGTTQVQLKLRDGKTKSVSVALGQSGFDVYRLCKSAKIYADDDPWLIAMAAGEGMYIFLFCAEGTPEEMRGRLDPRRDKLYALLRYPTDARDKGKFLIPKTMEGRDCGDFVTLKVLLGPDTARVATVAEGMNRTDVMQLFAPAVDHAEHEQMALFDAIHNNGRYLLLFDSGDADNKTLSTVMYWPGGENKSMLLLPRGQHDKAIPAKHRLLLERDRE